METATFISAVAALVAVLGSVGAGFFFIGMLTGRVGNLEKGTENARVTQIRCQAERGEVEGRLFDKLNELGTAIQVIEQKLDN